jgi:hypothetical protein
VGGGGGWGDIGKKVVERKKTFKRYTKIHTLTFLTYLSRGCPKKSYNTIAAFSLSSEPAETPRHEGGEKVEDRVNYTL